MKINDADSYKEEIESTEESLKRALGVRKFEINLYWKRTTYFWTLITAAFAGYFALETGSDKNQLLIYIISCIGLVLSLAWFLVNRGSKYWQENWERHVDVLENDSVGSLFKTTISENNFSFWKF